MNFIKLLTILIVVPVFLSFGFHDENHATSKRIDNYLTQSMSNGFSGAVLVVKNDKIILSKGYGFANKEKGIPNSPQIVYDICSVTKQFTAAAILKLAEAHKLELTDPLSKYFKQLPDDKKNITIHQLLSHSAGFVHGIGGDFDQIPREEYFHNLFNSKLLFPSGTKYEYSNAGYSILARIIELVSGEDYEHFMNKNIFKPSGMEQTGYLIPDWNEDQVASEYLYNVSNEGNSNAKYKRDGKIAWPLKGNGGINSTQEDMYKWFRALNSYKILTKESVEKLTHPHVPENTDSTSFYAYGWAIFTSGRDTKVISHNGFNGISYYEFVWFPEENALILFASNAFTREVGRMTLEIENMLFDKKYTAQPIKKDKVGIFYEFTENFKGDIKNLGASIESRFKEVIDSQDYLNRLGGIYLRNQNYGKAIPVFELNIRLYADDGNLWDSLGEAYAGAGKTKKAIICFQKALELCTGQDCRWRENSEKKLRELTNN